MTMTAGRLLARLVLLAAAACIGGGAQALDDWHYPAEEAQELAAASPPLAVTVGASTASLLPANGTGTAVTVAVGDVAFGAWHVVGILPSAQPWPCVVLEREFERHAVLVFTFEQAAVPSNSSGGGPAGVNNVASPARPPRVLRKSAGRLSGLRQPYFNFTGAEPDYFTRVETDNGDFPSRRARNRSADGELSFAAIATALAPQRDVAAISLAPHVVKFAVTHAGRVKCATRSGEDDTSPYPSGGAGVMELQDSRAPPPNNQTVVFDPRDHLAYWPSRFEHNKVGLLGGSLSVANVAAFSPDAPGHTDTRSRGGSSGQGHGYDLVAFAPFSGSRSSSSDSTNDGDDAAVASAAAQPPPCEFTPEIKGTYVKGYPASGNQRFPSLAQAQAACSADITCGGVTFQYGVYGVRAGSWAEPDPPPAAPASSWLVVNASKPLCHPLPRVPGIDYAPTVLVRLREQVGPEWVAPAAGAGAGAGAGNATSSFRYFRTSNATVSPAPPAPATATEFYLELLEVVQYHDALLAPSMTVRLPGAEGARQVDMAHSGMLNALNNYVGNHSNYGFGSTYWSISREDNGSLPLIPLSVDEALIDWGMCDLARGHLGYWFSTNVLPDTGEVNYWTWGGASPMAGADSIADYGRLVDLYVKAALLCPDDAWAAAQLPYVHAIGRKMLRERADAAAGKYVPPPPRGCEGLVNGAPEHDWGSVKDKYFFNNNAWQLRGMEVLGDFLTATTAAAADPPGRNATLGRALLADAVDYRAAVQACVAACTVLDPATKAPAFLPPFANLTAVPYATMGESRESSYANFRFWSETLLAELMPPGVEAAWLHYHNAVGGRVGGASKFEAWLDDMPSTGWGFGALANNATDDFQALLYGHMATYQSRGTFHSTEQLSFNGEGLYRAFLHNSNDPLPPPDLIGSGGDAGIGGGSLGDRGDGGTGSGGGGGDDDRAVADGLGYYAMGNDVSYCSVTNVMAARLTRWQLVMEDAYRNRAAAAAGGGAPLTIWLARGAPRRWFALAGGGGSGTDSGFAVGDAPTRAGRVSYNVTVAAAGGTAAFAVRLATVGGGDSVAAAVAVVWKLRWPGPLQAAPRALAGCTVDAVDMVAGVVSVRATAAAFRIEADF